MAPPPRVSVVRISATVRLRLSVTAWMSTAAPPGAYPSYVISSSITPSPPPTARWMARSMLAFGMLLSRAFWIARRRAGFMSGSAPERAAIVTSRPSLVNSLPRFASVAAFLCLIDDHLE